MNAAAVQIYDPRMDEERRGVPVAAPRVMPKGYRENRQLMLADFMQKNAILGYVGEFAPHELFYQDYFHAFQFNQDEHLVVVKSNADKSKGEKGTMSYPSIRAMCEDVRNRTDSYVCPVSMFAPIAKKRFGSKIYAFVVDLDGVDASDLQLLIEKNFHDLKPTYIVNSGGGLHLVYVLAAPIRYFDYRKRALDKIYKCIRDAHIDTDMSYKVDKRCGLIHSFRIVGSLTKIGTIAAAFKVGDWWDIETLADEAGITIPDEPPKRERRTHEKKDVTPLPSAKSSGWYQSTYNYIIEHVKQGYRHSSMFALMIVAMKTRTRRDRLQKDLEVIRDHFNASARRDKIEEDYPAYLADYGKITIAQRVSKSTLEELLGMEHYLGHGYQPCKRNGRKQADHLATLAAKKSKKELVEAYLANHPAASIKEIMDATGASRMTVVKHRREIAVAQKTSQEAVQALSGDRREESIAQPTEASQERSQTQEKPRHASPVYRFTHEDLVHLQAQILSTPSPGWRDILLQRLPDEHQRTRIRQMWDNHPYSKT